jgi:putative transposase
MGLILFNNCLSDKHRLFWLKLGFLGAIWFCMNRIQADHPCGVYHCISRVNGRLMLLNRPEVKEQFVKMLVKVAPFCEMEVLAFCVMGNHFHVLVREREVKVGYLNDRLLKQKMLLLYGKKKGQIEFMFHENMRKTNSEAADANLRRFERMMGDVSWFMRLLKQRFSVWYNRSFEREGTFWSERFKSVLVEDSEDAIRTMAAYIDLNPVRAGIAKDPRKYRWCTIGAAMGGLEFAQRGLMGVCETSIREEMNTAQSEDAKDLREWPKVRDWWSCQLAFEGEEVKDAEGRMIRRGMDPKVIKQMLNSGTLKLSQVLCCRVRYFVDGGVIGSREFVRKVVARERGKILPLNRKSEGNRMGRGSSPLNALFSLRKLKNSVVPQTE